MSGLLLNVWAMGKKKAANEEMLTECQLKQCGARAYTGGGARGQYPFTGTQSYYNVQIWNWGVKSIIEGEIK